MIVEQSDRMAHIVEHVRRFAGEAGSPDVSAVQVNDVVQSAIGMIGSQLRARGIEVAVETEADLPLVQINPFSLEEVVLSLLTNARDAVEQAGRADGAAEESVMVRVRTHGGEAGVEVVVEDRGAGIREELLDRVFEPFFTTKAPDRGTGGRGWRSSAVPLQAGRGKQGDRLFAGERGGGGVSRRRRRS